jgi:hypothetical protein
MSNIRKQIFKGDGELIFKCSEAVLKNIIDALLQHIGSFIDYECTILKTDHSSLMRESSDFEDRKCGKILYLNDNSKIVTSDGNLFDICIDIICAHSLDR